MNKIFERFSFGASVALALSTAALAQWSIGQPGTREPPPGQNRYVYLVMADPLPGREADFNGAAPGAGRQRTTLAELHTDPPGAVGGNRLLQSARHDGNISAFQNP